MSEEGRVMKAIHKYFHVLTDKEKIKTVASFRTFLEVSSEEGLLFFKGGNPAAGSPTATLLRLNPSHPSYRVKLPPLLVSSLHSGRNSFHGLTGSVYKTRERIHRGVLIHDY